MEYLHSHSVEVLASVFQCNRVLDRRQLLGKNLIESDTYHSLVRPNHLGTVVYHCTRDQGPYIHSLDDIGIHPHHTQLTQKSDVIKINAFESSYLCESYIFNTHAFYSKHSFDTLSIHITPTLIQLHWLINNN